MINAVLIIVLTAMIAFLAVSDAKYMLENKQAISRINDMLAALAKNMADISERTNSLEDFEALLKQQFGENKHIDYWTSVMEYNPYTVKEKDK